MAEKVTCIVRGDQHKYSDCRCITQITTDGGTYSRERAHEKVKTSPGSIYVEAGGSRSDVVAAEREGLKYVRTAPNDTTQDNLLKANLVEQKLTVILEYLSRHFPGCHFDPLTFNDANDYLLSFVHNENTYTLQIGRPVMEDVTPSPEEFRLPLEAYAVAERLKLSSVRQAVLRL